MEIKIWDGGLQEQEVIAINKIKAAFSEQRLPLASSGRKTISLADLQSSRGQNGMFPWKGYAGFRFVDAKGKEGEFDLVIVTHCNVLIIELKDWNHQPITASGDNWYKGGKNMDRSPVSVTRGKVFNLRNKLKKLAHRFTNKGYPPFVDFFVVMTGNADFSQLPEEQLLHTISLDDFLKFSDSDVFHRRFQPHSNAKVLNKDFHLFDELFLGNQTKPKSRNYAGYVAKEEIFEHPKKIYKEFLANAESTQKAEALLRVWNFNKIDGNKAYTPDGRAEIVSREREVLNYINHNNLDLYNHCLRSLTSFQKDEVTTEYSEVYELPPGHLRFNEFIGRFGQALSEQDRFNLTKLLIAKFADLHEIKVAHRDIADHSLWLSGTKRVALSNFISAYHQPIGTVGDYRQTLSVGAVEAKDMLEEENLTPFQQDVHALGLVAWHLLNAKAMTPKSLVAVADDVLACEHWYASIVLDAIAGRFATATEFFDTLFKGAPVREDIPTFDSKELEPYRRAINHSRHFREDDDFIVETSDKEVYVSEGLLVKAWLNIDDRGDNPASSFELLNLLKRVDKLCAVNPSYLPTIRDYGIASKSHSLYLVTDRVEGVTWDKVSLDSEEQLATIKKLVVAVEHLHSLGQAHGDIHPGNVMLETKTNKLFLIDIPDYSPTGEPPKNHRYSPENIDSCTAFERDNYAVMKMSCELLGVTWSEKSEIFPALSIAIQEELQDVTFGFKDLARFNKALIGKSKDELSEVIEVIAGRADGVITILPDNGKLYVKVEKYHKNPSWIKVSFSGVGGRFEAIYDKVQSAFVRGFDPRSKDFVSMWDEKESNFEINKAIRILPGYPSNLMPLSDLLKGNEAFLRAVDFIFELNFADNEPAALTQELKDAFEKLEYVTEEKLTKRSVDISTAKLWRAILDTETESYPNIEVNGAVISSASSHGELIVPYSTDVDPLDCFKSGDEVEALLVDADGSERFIGGVSLKNSALNEIRVVNARSAAFSLKEGDVVYFRSKQDRASYRKRKVALERLLDRGGMLPNLMDLFEPSCDKVVESHGINVTDEDFARYDREDLHGNKISLNEQQRIAFSKLVNYGPLSLLQGPPGTGKTEFIAAFVHYLIEKHDAKRILLVSQSHEAVNTAAERIRKHCARLNTVLEVVRFSNREAAVSDGLKDVYSASITTEKRELFEAEYKHRVGVLSTAIGLDAEFIAELLQAELKLFKKIDNLHSLLNSENQEIDKADVIELKKIAVELDINIRTLLFENYGIVLTSTDKIVTAKDKVIEKLCHDFSIRPHQITRARALAKVSRDMLDAWSGERVNCDEFYARSRQLVAGTCVGIGQGHIGIQDNIYDWVIIDEAARSIASELAIAMQSARRVLLVGDHLQLPPLYSDAHKIALARKLGIPGEKEDLDEVLQSDFARVFNSEYGKQTSAALLTQYRMAPAIGSIVSETFYNGKLLNGNRKVPSVYADAPEALQSVVTWLDTADLGDRAHHSEAKGNSRSISNRCEAEKIIELLKQIDKNNDFVDELSKLTAEGDATIGVICMYAEQKRLLRQKFNQEVWSEGFKQLVKIDTVDSYQGKENRIIILSLTRSDKRCSAGFLRAPNRINVAMSRAMDRLIIVGNSNMWKGNNRELPLGQVVSYMSENGLQAGYCFIKVSLGERKNNVR